MDDVIRVTAKKIDDLQDVIAFVKTANFGLALAICKYEILIVRHLYIIFKFIWLQKASNP